MKTLKEEFRRTFSLKNLQTELQPHLQGCQLSKMQLARMQK